MAFEISIAFLVLKIYFGMFKSTTIGLLVVWLPYQLLLTWSVQSQENTLVVGQCIPYCPCSVHFQLRVNKFKFKPLCPKHIHFIWMAWIRSIEDQ